MSKHSVGEPSLQKSTRNTVVVMLSTFISRLLGFIRIAVIGSIFGATGEADVLNAVFTIPNNLRKLLAEGALSSAFIPVLSHSLMHDKSPEPAKKIVRNIITFQLLILIPLCVFSILFAKPLMSHVLIDFDDPELTTLSIDLFRFFINYLILISISAVLIATLNSHNNFFIPAITPILFSISVIVSIILLHRYIGVFSMAVGILFGGAMQIVFQTPAFKKIGYDFKLDINFNNGYFKRVMRQWLPVVATASIFTINQQIAIRFATGLETGSSSTLSYALVFFQLPYGIFSASITTVLFPRMSRQSSVQDIPGLRESIQYGIRFLLSLLVPSAILLAVMGKEIVSVALFRGAFTEADTLLTSHILIAYVIGLFSVGCFHFLQRFFYSFGNFKIPFYVALSVCILDVGLSLWLKETYLRVVGLAVANTISFSIGLLMLVFLVRRQVRYIGLHAILRTAGKITASMVPLVLFLLLYLRLTGDWWREGSSLKTFGLVLIPGGLSLGIVFLMYYLLNVEMVSNLIRKRRIIE